MAFDPVDRRVPLGPDRPQRHPPRLRRRVDRRALQRGLRRRCAARPSTARGTWGSGCSTRRRSTATARRSGGSGRCSRDEPRDAFVLSTKVGRLVRLRRGDPARRRHRPPAVRRPRRRVLRRRRPGADRVRLLRRRRPAVDRGEPRAARPRPDRHRPDPRPGRPLAGGHRRAYPALARLREEGVIRADRRGDEPVGDARPVRPRGRHRRLPRSPAATRSSTRTRSTSCCRPALERGVGVFAAGVMNSGVLADPRRRAAASTTRRRRPRSSSGPGGSPRSAPATTSRSARRPSSSRWPIPR